jgi:hypothetical protein
MHWTEEKCKWGFCGEILKGRGNWNTWNWHIWDDDIKIGSSLDWIYLA